jgi:predicted dehydrogenase
LPQAYYSIDFISGCTSVVTKNSDTLESESHHPKAVDALLAQSQAFIESIALNKPPVVSGMAGLRALSVVERIQESIASRVAQSKAVAGAQKGEVDWGKASS